MALAKYALLVPRGLEREALALLHDAAVAYVDDSAAGVGATGCASSSSRSRSSSNAAFVEGLELRQPPTRLPACRGDALGRAGAHSVLLSAAQQGQPEAEQLLPAALLTCPCLDAALALFMIAEGAPMAELCAPADWRLREHVPRSPLHFGCDFAAAGAATAITGPLNYARNRQFSAKLTEAMPSTMTAVRGLLLEAASQPTWRQGAGLFLMRTNVGWGTLRVAGGMAVTSSLFAATVGLAEHCLRERRVCQ